MASYVCRYGSILLLEQLDTGFPVLDTILSQASRGEFDCQNELKKIQGGEIELYRIITPMIYSGEKPYEILKKMKEIVGKDICADIEVWFTRVERKLETAKNITELNKIVENIWIALKCNQNE